MYIKDGIIESVGAEPGVSADRCIDAAGKTVMPGFVNTHTHLPMNLFRSYADDMPLMTWLEEKIWPSEARMDETAVYYGAMAALAEMAMGGVTAFADAYYLYDWYIEAIRKSGMRALIGRYGLRGRREKVFRDARYEKEYERRQSGRGFCGACSIYMLALYA